MLRCYVEDHPSDWCLYARSLCYAYNTSVHSAINTTPFHLLLSRPPPEFTLVPRTRSTPAKVTREDFERRLEVAIGKACASLREAQERYKRNY